MAELYPGMPGSPITYLTANVTASQTSIPINDETAVPNAPNICTIRDGTEFETIKYAGKESGSLTGCERGAEGTAKAWAAGTEVARYFTAYDQQAIIDNFAALAAPLEWHELPLINGWTGSIKYCKNTMGIVSIRGGITSETMSALTYVSESLPAEYNPYVHTAMQSVQYRNGIPSSSIFYLMPDRGVRVSNTTNFAKGETYAISCMYQV